MRTKILLGFLLAVLFSSCQSELDEMYGRESVTDTFVLVDYYAGVYKFVQIDNQYTIGVSEGVLDIPVGFTAFENEEVHSYYEVELTLTGIQTENGTTRYQKYTGESNYYLIKQAGKYHYIDCLVQRVEFFNDYLYYLVYNP